MNKKERLNVLIDHYSDGKPTQFAKYIGVAPSTISSWLSRCTFDYDLLFAKCENISPDWLLSGTGPMLKSPDTVNQPNIPTAPTTTNTSTNDLIPLTESKEKILDVSDIPLYNIDASAGLNKLFADGGELLGRISIPNAPHCDGAVHVIGDSMYPLLKSGDIIAYRIVNDLQSINFGEIYILQLLNNGDMSIVVKYVKHSDIDSDHIRLVSYNKEHDPKDIPLSWIQAIARVTFCIRRFSII